MFPPIWLEPSDANDTGAPSSATHNLMVNSYYVSPTSTLIPGAPTLRRKTLTVRNGAPFIEDQEVAPGVENIQLQLGIDVDEDLAREAMRLAANKLPVKCKFVKREDV